MTFVRFDSGMSLRQRLGLIIWHQFLAAGLLAALLAGCGGQDPTDVIVGVRGIPGVTEGTGVAGNEALIQVKGIPELHINTSAPEGSRHFLLGAVPVGAPGPIVTDAYLAGAIAFTAKAADCFVIRQKVDWEAFRPGGIATPDFTNDIIKLVDSARAAGFTHILVELDPIVDRHHIGPLPPAIDQENFSGPSVRHVLKTQAIEVARRARPDFFSFGVEINGYYESNPDDFINFVSLHKEIYDEVKAISPETVVMPSFNLEAIQGLLKGVNEFSNHGPQWFLIDMFEPKLDAVAFSTLPFPVFYRPIQIPENYISQIQDHTSRPIVLSEIGWTTSTDAGSDEQQQRDYIAVMARQAMRTPQLRVMAWTILFDAGDGSIFDAFPAFKYLGLLTPDSVPKLGFTTWAGVYQMPYVPPGAP